MITATQQRSATTHRLMVTQLQIDVVDGIGREVGHLPVTARFEFDGGGAWTVTRVTDHDGVARFDELHDTPLRFVTVTAAGETERFVPSEGHDHLVIEV